MKHDYRTREGRDSEVLAQIEIDGGLSVAWVEAIPARGTALQRLVRSGRVRHLNGGSFQFQRYEVVQPAGRSLWMRFRVWLLGVEAV
jgi:hypothetical protein